MRVLLMPTAVELWVHMWTTAESEAKTTGEIEATFVVV